MRGKDAIELQPGRAGRRTISTFRHVLRNENAVLFVILIVIMVVLTILTKGLTASRGNITNIMLQSAARGVASVGQAFVVLTGGIDISMGGIGLMAAAIGSLMMTSRMELNIIGFPLPAGIGILMMLLVGLGIGTANGFFVARRNVPALIVTLAVWRILYGVGFAITKERTITYLPPSLDFLGRGYIGPVPVQVCIFVAVAATAYFVLYHTTFGRAIYAAGGQPVSAWLSGIPVNAIRHAVYAISGFLAGLAAILAVSRASAASIITLRGLELDTIAIIAIGGISLAGGRGSLIGVILGIAILGVINNGMNIIGLGPIYQDIAKGAIILAAVTVQAVRRR